MKISIGFTTIFVVFLILKLTGVIAWSWWWVTSPIWSLILVAIMIIIIAMFNKK